MKTKLLIPFLLFSGTLLGLMMWLNQNEKSTFAESRPKTVTIHPGSPWLFSQWDEIGQFPPLSEVQQYKVVEGKEAYRVTYKLNEFGLRDEKSSGTFSKHLIVGGCSFVFGIAIEAGQTVTSNLRAILHDDHIVNFGHGNGGLHTQIRSFELHDMNKIVPEPEGTYYYVFIPDHLARWKATPAFVNGATPNTPHYFFDGGELKYEKIKDSQEQLKFKLFKSLNLQFVYQQFAYYFHDELSIENLESFSDGVKILKQKYESIYPEGKFVFVFHPLYDLPDHRLHELLKKKSISYFDPAPEFENYRRETGQGEDSFIVKDGGHPNQKMNLYFAEKLNDFKH